MSDYLESVDHYCKGMDVAVGASAICGDCLSTHDIADRDARGRFRSVDDMQAELSELDTGSFSWAWCDTCGSSFGGDRHSSHGLIDGAWYHLEVCTDCLFFFANGDVPEMWTQHPARYNTLTR